MRNQKTIKLVQAAVIAALYVVPTMLANALGLQITPSRCGFRRL